MQVCVVSPQREEVYAIANSCTHWKEGDRASFQNPAGVLGTLGAHSRCSPPHHTSAWLSESSKGKAVRMLASAYLLLGAVQWHRVSIIPNWHWGHKEVRPDRAPADPYLVTVLSSDRATLRV